MDKSDCYTNMRTRVQIPTTYIKAHLQSQMTVTPVLLRRYGSRYKKIPRSPWVSQPDVNSSEQQRDLVPKMAGSE